MSTPILTPTPQVVKAGALKVLASAGLQKYLQRPSRGLALSSNLTTQAYLLAHLPASEMTGGVVWFLPSNHDFSRACLLAQFFWPSQAPALKLSNFPEDLSDWFTNNQTNTAKVLLVAQAHLTLALPKPATVKRRTLCLQAGQELRPLDLLRALEGAGFEPGPLPDAGGWFIKQGGSVTVASSTGTWRLQWNGNTIERLEALNLATGQAEPVVKSITLPPRRLAPDQDTTLTDYLALASPTLIGQPKELKKIKGKSYPLDPLQADPLLASLPLFGRQWPLLAKYLTEGLAAGERINILSSEPQTIKYELKKHGLEPKITEVGERLSAELEGFDDRAGRVIWLTDREILGLKRRRPTRALASFERLTAGDYLVHIDHGIGRFVGLVDQTIDEVNRDYFLVEYAEGDKLFVPIEHTDRLSRYLGGPHPKLERLHSASWFQITKKVKVETARLASELLATYARRAGSQVAPWQHFTEEAPVASSFPWPLTPDQLKAWAEISADLDQTKPMDRLVCGDVGFGKTELAVRAAWRGILNHYQVALLAPTTILAQQHYDTFHNRLSPWGVRLSLISRAVKATEVRRLLADLASGQIDLIIGTHRLLAKDVHFRNLGLLVIDEEQRFGVKQKEELKAIKPALHVLQLSATPIPRTLNLSVSNLRDLSIITTPPASRRAVVTQFCQLDESVISQAINQELGRSGQIYYLVPHISDLATVAARLHRLVPQASLGIIHGRLPPQAVSATMHRFDEGQINILLATTIIENGLDLPNVNTLLVEGAERFGLADLYQLRGRVGRGEVQAYAYFLLGDQQTAAAGKRLEALAQANELGQGLTLALKDLELRGAGAILGREQHGQVSAVGLHLYGQLLAQAIEDLKTGEPAPTIPEVLLRLPLEGRLAAELIPAEPDRIQIYQRLAAMREPAELEPAAQEIIGRPLGDEPADRLFKNLLTLLELKLLAEGARLSEISCQTRQALGRFSLRFLEAPTEEIKQRLTNFDPRWHKVESVWQAEHPLAGGCWIPWLKESLRLLGK
ncbi:MAG: DEAD/DEAH box helicase [Candidatus Kerfeldbacteria bacterium]|nr:DEAD/DEAH box helicase [Candidatus Kerfeldbacteria bacterium]